MKLNNKGFTVVELLASFILTMIIVVFLFEIVLELRNVYINEKVRTDIVNRNAVIANSINKLLNEKPINNPICASTFCTFTVDTENGPVDKTISVADNTVTIDKQKVTFPEDVTITDIVLMQQGPTDTGIIANNSIIKISYKAQSDDLDKEVDFNFIYSYMD